MRIGSFTFFEKTIPPVPAPALVLGLQEAEKIFQGANGHIKADTSKAVPFAIVETAKALGAEVRIEEECAQAQQDLLGTVEKLEESLADFIKFSEQKILDLQRRVELQKESLSQGTEELNGRKRDILERHSTVSEIKEFFATS